MTIWEFLLTFSFSSICSVRWIGSEEKHWETEVMWRSARAEVDTNREGLLVRVGHGELSGWWESVRRSCWILCRGGMTTVVHQGDAPSTSLRTGFVGRSLVC